MSESDGQELQLTVPDGVRKDRADKILARLYPDLSRSRWQKLFQDGRVWSDDRALAQKDKLRGGDSVQFSIPPVQPLSLKPVPMDLDILFEDADILVLNKAAGVVVHPGAGTAEDTLVHGLLHHCQGSLTGIGGAERPGIVHRLDKETSGVLIVAKSDSAFQSLASQFAEREVKKYYKALVCGVPSPAAGSVHEAIGRHSVHRVRMTCREDGRPAHTDYQLEKNFAERASLLHLQIHTGRTHQIRVHLKHLGHPILGDTLYGYKPARLGGEDITRDFNIPRVMLHAAQLEFTHPASGQPVTIEAPLPADFAEVMKQLEGLSA